MAFTETRTRIMEMAAELESTYGSDPTIAGAQDGFAAIDSNVTWNSDIQLNEYRNHGGSFTRGLDVPGIRLGRLNCTVKMQGSGTAGTAVQGLNDMLQACGLTETVVASTSVTYSPSTIALLKSAYIQSNQNGFLATMAGSYGNCVFSARSGEPIKAAFSMQGLYSAPAIGSIASWAVGTTGADRAKPFLGVSLVLNNGTDSWTGPTFLGFSFDLGNDIRQIPDANSSTGLKKLMFADRAPTITIDLVLDTDTAGTIIQANEFYADALAQTTHDIGFNVNGGAGNILTFNVDKGQLRNPQIQDGDGFRTFSLPYKGTHTTAESEFSIVAT